MKKTLKIVLWTIVIIIAIPLILVATLPLWLGPIARPALNELAPTLLKADFNVGKLYFNPYTCNFLLGDVRIGNPEGFLGGDAITIGKVAVDVDTASLASEVIVVENVEVCDFSIALQKNDAGKDNLTVLKENAIGETSSDAGDADPSVAESAEQAGEQAGKEESRINRKIIINHFLFKNVSGKFGPVPFRIPTVELKDIGKDSGGYDLDNLYVAVLEEFVASVVSSASDLGSFLGDGAGKAVDAIKDLKNVDFGAAGDAVKDAGEKLKDVGKSLKGIFK